MDFSEVYDRYADDIKVTAMSQRVPGLDYDDVVSEMLGCLWRAWESFDPDKANFGSYWWSLWLNRRSNLTRDAYRLKRPSETPRPMEYMPDVQYLMHLMPSPPERSSAEAKTVWTLLAAGEAVKDVIAWTGLSRRRYYALVKSWRREEIRRSLTD